MKYFKIVGLIAIVLAVTGCASGGGTAVTVYDSSGNKVQETSKDAVMLNAAYNAAAECEKNRGSSGNVNLGIIDPASLSKMSPSAQTEYMRTLPMLHMAGALKSATAKAGNPCQESVVAYYNHLNVVKQQNASLWRKGLGIAGFIGGAYVIGNTVEGILQSAVSAGGTTTSIEGSRVNMDSGNNYSSPGANANASSSGDGLGTNNLFPDGTSDSTIYGGNQPRGTTTDMNDQNGSVEFGSNSGDNAEQVTIPPIEPVPEI